MALTKVSGGILDPGINVAGIVTATGFDGPFTGGSTKNITAGIITATGFDLNGNGDISGNLVIGGNLTANGDFTTLNTTLREVEILRVDANTTAVAGIITQRGTGDILNLYDNTTEVFSVEDGGKVKIGMGALGTNTSDYDAAANNLIVGTGSGDEGITILSGQSVGHHGSIFFADGTGATNSKRGQIRYEQNSERMKFFTAGTQKLTIDINGKVGIGTDNPGAILDVLTSMGRIKFNNSGSIGSRIDFANADGTVKSSIHNYGGSNEILVLNTSGSIQFNISNSTKINLASNGRVGIGSVIPSQLLDVAGTIKTTNITSNSSNLSIENTADRVLIKSANRVDIADNMIRFQNRAQDAALLEAVAGASGYVKLYHNNNVVASVTMDALTVTGRTSNSGMVEIASNQGANNNDRFRIHKTSAASRLTIQNYSTGSWVENIRITAGGAVELKHADGTTKAYTQSSGLAVNGNINLYDAYPSITWEDTNHNSDFRITNDNGKLIVYDITRGEHVLDFLANGDLHVRGDKGIYFGESNDLLIGHDGSSTRIDDNFGYLNIRSNILELKSTTGSELYANFILNGSAKLYYDGTERFATSGIGVTVTGEVAASQDYPNFRPTLDLNFAAQKKLDPRITFQRTGLASFVNEFGKIVLIGANEPRFDHDPITRESKGLLIEESRTNLLKYSVDFASIGGYNANYSAARSTLTSTTELAPDGTNTASKYVRTTGQGTGEVAIIINNSLGLNNTAVYTSSVFVKNVGTNGTVEMVNTRASDVEDDSQFNLATGTIGVQGSNNSLTTITPYPNDWYRISVTATHNNLSGYFWVRTYGQPEGSGFLLWGGQVEAGSFPSSYIHTDNNASVTRGADLVEITEEEFSEFYNRTEGSFVSEIMLPSSWPMSGYGSYMMTLSDGSYNNRVTLASSTGSAQFNADINIGSNSPTRANLGSYTSGSHSIKAAMAYKISDSAGSLNGAAAVTSSPSGTLPLLTRADIGKDHANYNLLNGHVKRIMYYSHRIPNNQLRTLTS